MAAWTYEDDDREHADRIMIERQWRELRLARIKRDHQERALAGQRAIASLIREGRALRRIDDGFPVNAGGSLGLGPSVDPDTGFDSACGDCQSGCEIDYRGPVSRPCAEHREAFETYENAQDIALAQRLDK